jgi:nitric oxide reductase subunit B
METRGLRNAAIVSFVVSMAILLIGGYFALDKVPPIPKQVKAGDVVVIVYDGIMRGQQTYQSRGLMDHGSIWGHGSLRGMDFSAATLHLVGQAMRDYYSSPQDPRENGFGQVPPERRAQIESRVIAEIHANTYDPASRTLRLNPAQDYALKRVEAYWDKVFNEGDKEYGFLPATVADAADRKDMADFFFWTAWAAGTDRPGLATTYTNNWPPDRSVGNQASASTLVWSLFSILSLLIGLGVIVYIVHRYKFFYGEERSVEAGRKMLELPLTPSQRATAKYFLVAGLLFVLQIFNGGLLAHYTVHPGSFYVEFVARLVPYSWAKTWHLQLAVFWIAISWVGTAILLAPVIAGKEPKHQALLVNILFAAVFLVVAGSLTGEVLGIKGMLGNWWFWLGHQGWEYLELGKLWQALLFGGLVFWLFIVYRPLGAWIKSDDGKKDEERRALIVFYVLSAIAVVAFFGFGLFYGKNTHLTVADYWRWFVVHIWVESIFEFFGVAVTALFLVALGLVSAKSALRVAYLTGILVFLSGIPGTAHHYFWYGGPGFWLAIGGVFSSLEPIPLILLVTRAWMEYKSIRDAGREFPYRWPLFFLTASSFWNFLGAGVFGFLINLPIVNYYEHATYLTANHGHTALFGVYGMLAISLILFSWRSLVPNKEWNDKILKLSFWGLNGGLFLMFSTSLLPVGIMQTWHSYNDGFWLARSAAFYEMPIVKILGTWRIVPDTIIIVLGAFPLLYFLATTFLKLRKTGEKQVLD